MINVRDAVIWVDSDAKEVMVRTLAWGVPVNYGLGAGRWGDPIGAAYSQWQKRSAWG